MKGLLLQSFFMRLHTVAYSCMQRHILVCQKCYIDIDIEKDIDIDIDNDIVIDIDIEREVDRESERIFGC